jgi:sec-independent protein translocase protein TatB
MFDIGFLELLIVALLALLVIGPERLPGAIRTAALWITSIKRTFLSLKASVEEEIDADEIKRELHNQSVLKSLEDAKQDLESFKTSVNKSSSELEYDINDVLKNIGGEQSGNTPSTSQENNKDG